MAMSTKFSLTNHAGFLAMLFVVVLAVPVPSWAALDAYMRITGQSQGEIKGDVTLAGREDSILVVSFGYNVSTPYDPATGLVSGKRQHRPVRILKNIDQATPLLFNAMVNNELLTNVTIQFWKPDNTGGEVHYYTVELLNAHIVSIMPSQSSADAASTELPFREVISFTFDTIITTFEDGGISAQDSWAGSSN
jgi:type VI secretion system secreted protein Hcp